MTHRSDEDLEDTVKRLREELRRTISGERDWLDAAWSTRWQEKGY
jgi:hypothetical protein